MEPATTSRQCRPFLPSSPYTSSWSARCCSRSSSWQSIVTGLAQLKLKLAGCACVVARTPLGRVLRLRQDLDLDTLSELERGWLFEGDLRDQHAHVGWTRWILSIEPPSN